MTRITALLHRAAARLSTKIYSDEYLDWLRFANAGMMHPGNIFAIKHAIERLPTSGSVIEIGSFCGLSTNVISYFLKVSNKSNKVFCSDNWVFEGSELGATLGGSGLSHSELRTHVLESFLRNVSFFSQRRPHPIELCSDRFFEEWSVSSHVKDVFGRRIKLGGGISFGYVDGNHTYEYAKRDFLNLDKHLVAGGFIFFDDSSDGNLRGLSQLMKEIEKNPKYRLVMKNPNYLFRKA